MGKHFFNHFLNVTDHFDFAATTSGGPNDCLAQAGEDEEADNNANDHGGEGVDGRGGGGGVGLRSPSKWKEF